MKIAEKRVKNFEFQFVALAILVRRDFTFETLPLHVRSNWISLEGLNADRRKTKNRKLAKFLRANQTKKQRAELMKKVCVLFD